MLKLVYFDFNFWRVDILRLSLSYSNIPYEYERIPRKNWVKKKKDFPFGQLPVIIFDGKTYAHTHTLAKFCAKKSSLYENVESKVLIIDQVIDWANEVTNLIAPSIRAAIREKDFEKSKKLRQEFIEKDLNIWFSYLEKLLENCSVTKKFFTDRFTIADITAWRMIYWFTCGKLELIDASFLNDLPILKNYFNYINNFEPLTRLNVFKDVTTSN